MTRRWVTVLIALPIVYTAAILMAASANRATPRAPIVLTQREAMAPPRNDENSAVRLRLAWQPAFEPASWFDRDKLREVGFDVSVDPASLDAERHYQRVLPRAAYVAFELAGPAWEAFLASREATELLEPRVPEQTIREYGSRLVPVDAAADANALTARYPDGRRHLITAAIVGLSWVRPQRGAPYLAGHVRNIEPNSVYVPRDLARQLPLRDRIDPAQRPYDVTLAYGSRWEPWVTAVNRGGASR